MEKYSIKKGKTPRRFRYAPESFRRGIGRVLEQEENTGRSQKRERGVWPALSEWHSLALHDRHEQVFHVTRC
jgi:hypothetical protein